MSKDMVPVMPPGASEDEVMAAILTVFAHAINPTIDREIAYDLICQAMDQGGLGLHNAVQWGTLVKQTAYGAKRSNARH